MRFHVRPFRLTWALGLVLVLSSCATVNHDIRFRHGETELPVSGSAFLEVDGEEITPADYRATGEIVYDLEVSVPMRQTAPFEVRLSESLQEQADTFPTDALVNFTFGVKNVRTYNIRLVAFERLLGIASLSFAAIPFLLYGDYWAEEHGSPFSSPYFIGGVGAGVALLGGSLLHQRLANIPYTFEVTATAVELR